MPDHTQPLTPDDAEIAAAYKAHRSVLEYVAAQKFHVPAADVPDVLQNVFLAFIRNRRRIRADERAWLIGAMCMECRVYWRARGRDDVLSEMEDDFDVAARDDDLVARATAVTILRRLPRACRELLRLRFYEQLTSEEIAERYTTTIGYARKLVHRCVVSARAMFVRRRRDG